VTPGADIPDRELRQLVPGLEPRKGERWRLAPAAPRVVVSTHGRAAVLPTTVRQRAASGRESERRLRGRLLAADTDFPKVVVGRSEGGSYNRVDLARSVLGAFVREPRGRELALRLNGVHSDCRLENLLWSGDRTAALLDRFLADEEGCLDAYDLELAALRLGVSRSVLCMALKLERARLGVQVKPGPKSPRQVAEALRQARLDMHMLSCAARRGEPCDCADHGTEAWPC
jgi:hypothetical protein